MQKRKIAHSSPRNSLRFLSDKRFSVAIIWWRGTTCTNAAGYALAVLQCRVRRVSICKLLWRCAGCGCGRCIVTARVADQSCARRMTSLSHVFKPFGNCFSGQLKTSLSFWLPHTHTQKKKMVRIYKKRRGSLSSRIDSADDRLSDRNVQSRLVYKQRLASLAVFL